MADPTLIAPLPLAALSSGIRVPLAPLVTALTRACCLAALSAAGGDHAAASELLGVPVEAMPALLHVGGTALMAGLAEG